MFTSFFFQCSGSESCWGFETKQLQASIDFMGARGSRVSLPSRVELFALSFCNHPKLWDTDAEQVVLSKFWAFDWPHCPCELWQTLLSSNQGSRLVWRFEASTSCVHAARKGFPKDRA